MSARWDRTASIMAEKDATNAKGLEDSDTVIFPRSRNQFSIVLLVESKLNRYWESVMIDSILFYLFVIIFLVSSLQLITRRPGRGC